MRLKIVGYYVHRCTHRSKVSNGTLALLMDNTVCVLMCTPVCGKSLTHFCIGINDSEIWSFILPVLEAKSQLVIV